MYQLQGFRARLFSDTISPCSNEASGPGRQNAAEWLRVGFHDMSTANTYFGIGGLDASLQFELTNGENTGPGHNTTLKFLSNYLSPRSSMADLIAAGVYASVRSCGGPIVPVRAGRVDATIAGNAGVPQPQNSIGTFKDQFDRMGFSVTEMIQVVACGHTLGGVHTTEFPDIVPAGTTANGEAGLDSTVAAFDNKVVTEYLDNSTTNPLVVGPAVKINKHADFKVFNADQNITMKALTDPVAFQNICKTVLQKMIDVVPGGVVLTADGVTPYMVKPVDLQLTLNTPGSTLLLSGYIRVRTTNLPSSSISNLKFTYRDRNGGNNCGTCSTTATVQGAATGFDDSFGFFPISANIDATTGISAFSVTINLKDGTSQTYDNNGNLYPISDAVFIQKPQSCLLQGSGALTATALVRNDRTALPVSLGVSYLVPRNTANGNPVPALNTANVTMVKGDCVGQYTFYTASYTIPGGLSYNAKLDITSGSGGDNFIDGFNAASGLAGTCATFAGGVACGGATTSSTSSSSSSVSTKTTSTTSSMTSSSTSTLPTLGHRSKIGVYNLLGCWTEGQNARTLKGAASAYDGMTLESCMADCAGFAFWGTEYGRECYCGNTLDSTSASAPLADCSMTCGGDTKEYCGAGNRLELYSNAAPSSTSSGTTLTSTSRTGTSSSSSTSTTSSTSITSKTATISSTTSSITSSTSSSASPSQTLGHKTIVGKYTLVGCATEGTGVRALSANSYADDAMSLESCASFCDAYSYFGTEYGRECYCGNSLASSSTTAPLSDCSMTCKGSPFEYCGNGNRLELYSVAALSSRAISSTTTSSSSSSSSTKPTTSSTTSTTLTSSTRTSSFTSTSSSSSSSSTKSSTIYTSTSPSSSSTKSFTSSSSTSSTKSAISSTSTSSTKSSTMTTSIITTSTASTSASASPTLAHKPTVSPYSLVGCWTEGTGVRALSSNSYSSGTSMTLESCATFCKSYKYFGTEYGGECYCGDTLASTSTSALLSDCNMVCSGNPLEYCGAGNRLELYINNSTATGTVTGPAVTTTAASTGPTQPATVAVSGVTWKWKSCYTEATTGRALSSTTYAGDAVTLESCATFCSGYAYFGTEYGRECYCGNSFAAGSVATAAGECSMKCAGDANEFCGAGSRLSVYAKQ